jgi:hypothetical protein
VRAFCVWIEDHQHPGRSRQTGIARSWRLRRQCIVSNSQPRAAPLATASTPPWRCGNWWGPIRPCSRSWRPWLPGRPRWSRGAGPTPRRNKARNHETVVGSGARGCLLLRMRRVGGMPCDRLSTVAGSRFGSYPRAAGGSLGGVTRLLGCRILPG